jgi:hypothetical protein
VVLWLVEPSCSQFANLKIRKLESINIPADLGRIHCGETTDGSRVRTKNKIVPERSDPCCFARLNGVLLRRRQRELIV